MFEKWGQLAEKGIQKIRVNPRQKTVIFGVMALVLWGAVIAITLDRTKLNSVFAADVSIALTMTLMVKLLGWLPLDGASYLVLLPLSMVVQLQYVPNFLMALLFALGLCGVLFLRLGYIRRYYIQIALMELFAAVYSVVSAFLYQKFIFCYFELSAKYHIGPAAKAAIILFSYTLLVLLFVAALKGLEGLLRRRQGLWLRLSKRMAGLEVYVFLLISLVGMTISFCRLFFEFPRNIGVIQYSWIFLLFIDAAYICLLANAMQAKERISAIENEKNVISAYSVDLESSLDHMREIRHDVKNLFLTMGGFVEESGDERMKEFYRENMVPFMKDAITQSEFHDKLRVLEDEPLKSFFFYKLTEKIGYGVRVSLEVCAPVSVGKGYGDIIRILGILIDNAAEECLLTPEKEMGIRVTSDGTQTSFRIFNAVRPETRARGVIEGTTDKGLGRGNGLIIARRIIDKYGNLMLNSYFTEEGFIQNLTLLRPHA